MPMASSRRRVSSHQGDRVGAGSFSRPMKPLEVESSATGASVDHGAVDDDLLLGLPGVLARRAHGDEAELVALGRELGVRRTTQSAAQPALGVDALLVLDRVALETQLLV